MKIIIYFLPLFFFLQSCNLTPKGPSDEELSTMTRFEKWESLEKGMSKETVLRILGEPSSKKVWSGQTSYTFECFACTTTFNKNGTLWSWFAPTEDF